MIRIRLRGGLGNQMFEFAFGKALSRRLHSRLEVDVSWLLDPRASTATRRDYALDLFQAEVRFAQSPAWVRALARIPDARVGDWNRDRLEVRFPLIREAGPAFEAQWVRTPRDQNTYFGHWQSPDYFEAIADDLRQDFRFRRPVLPVSHALLQRIRDTESVCLHVRRGDYLQTPFLRTLDAAYFHNALALLRERVDRPEIFVFSDDLPWCRNHLYGDLPTVWVGPEHNGRKNGNALQLMQACRHFILPNSTFSWWAAWLNPDPRKTVIAPRHWFTDPKVDDSRLLPREWIRCSALTPRSF